MSKGTLYIAGPYTDEDIHLIKAQFNETLGKQIEFDVHEDNSLIAGFLALIDGRVYDASVRTKLSKDQSPTVYDYGTVVSSGDGIVKVLGLVRCQYGEKIAFEGDVYGLVMQLDRGIADIIILSNQADVRLGSRARSTGDVIEIPVGDILLGRIIDPLGNALDGHALNSNEYRAIEQAAPTIIQRGMVKRPLQTGILAIDAMIPIGKGQRELIIGDRQTGKTTIALDSILNQKGQDVICIYVAIGQKQSSVTKVYNELKSHGALAYTIILHASASSSAAMQYIAPYAGAAIAEAFMHEGIDVLIVYDDLSKHAIAYRTLSLLLKRPPGREAYPGDVFYLHSRLLERSAQLKDELGGGSITALPIVETLAGDISAYIPTNIISITDGQVYLESELFHAGIRPAINVGLSVSRVGGAAQTKAIRKLAGPLRLSLAQYRELKIFTQFGTDIDLATKQRLDYGQRLTSILVQAGTKPLRLSQQVALLLAATNKLLDHLDLNDIPQFKTNLLEYLEHSYRSELELIDQTGKLTDENSALLLEQIKTFISIFKGDTDAQ